MFYNYRFVFCSLVRGEVFRFFVIWRSSMFCCVYAMMHSGVLVLYKTLITWREFQSCRDSSMGRLVTYPRVFYNHWRTFHLEQLKSSTVSHFYSNLGNPEIPIKIYSLSTPHTLLIIIYIIITPLNYG